MNKAKIILVCVMWLAILVLSAMLFRWIIKPARQVAQEQAVEEKKQQVLTATGATSRYDHQVRFALDNFSGYAVLRSPEFSTELFKKRIKIDLIDDSADYKARLKSIQSGETQIAVFTVDALIKTCAELGGMPATIVAAVDETRGADAIVAFKSEFPNVDALDNADVKFILTPNSPSETLARVVMARFNLRKLNKTPFVEAKDAEDVYKQYRTAKAEARQVYVVWEPYVSKILENPNLHILIDSSRFRGYIVDVIIVNRDFLYRNKEVVSDIVESFFRANYTYRDKYAELVTQDAQRQGSPLSETQAANLVKGVWWKNTQENYAHFGLHDVVKLQHIEDIIVNLVKVLTATGGITKDPMNGKPNTLYYPGILEELKRRNFHPGVEDVRNDASVLMALTDRQWESLLPVGTLEVLPLVFPRGTALLTDASQHILNELVDTLGTFPQYYLVIKGNASKEGNLEANKQLASKRAKAAEQYLIQRGISDKRVRAIGVEPSGQIRVDFILGQTPY